MPLVIGRGAIPEVTRQRDATRAQLAVPSAIAYGDGPRSVSIGKVALHGFDDLDGERGRQYSDLVFHHLFETARAKLEALMNIDEPSAIANELVALGAARDIANGQIEGKTEGVSPWLPSAPS